MSDATAVAEAPKEVTPAVDFTQILEDNYKVDEATSKNNIAAVAKSDQKIGKSICMGIQFEGDEEGYLVPRVDLVRFLFFKDWHRNDISKLLGLNYQTIFSVTKGQENAVHGPGKSAQRGKKSGPVTVTITDAEGNPQEVQFESNKDYMIHLYATVGVPRGQIAKDLNLSYGAAYAATREYEKAANAKYDKPPKPEVIKAEAITEPVRVNMSNLAAIASSEGEGDETDEAALNEAIDSAVEEGQANAAAATEATGDELF